VKQERKENQILLREEEKTEDLGGYLLDYLTSLNLYSKQRHHNEINLLL
jgi:hypothetical protein